MKSISLLLSVFFSIASHHLMLSQTDSAIYGVVRSDQTRALSLSKINTTNGNVTVISHTAFPSPYFMNSIATIDTKDNHYYLFTNNSLVGVNVTTGNVSTTSALSISNPNYLEMMQYNRFDSTFYAMRYTNGSLYLVKVNPSNGLVTTITSNPLSASYYMNSLAAIDPFRKTYYIQAPNPGKIYGFDLVSGNVVSNALLDASIYTFQLMRFNPRDSVLYGIATPVASGNQYLAKLNPLSGAVTLISGAPLTTPLDFNAIATLDPNKRIYYVQVNKQLLGYDLSSGNLIINTLLNFPFPGRFDLMVYCLDCKNETPYGQAPTLQTHVVGPTDLCMTGAVALTSSSSATPAATYSWSSVPSQSASFPSGSTSGTTTVTFSAAGTYSISCVATNYLGSATSTQVVSISECTSLEEKTSLSDNIQLTPNPSSGIFHVTASKGLTLSSVRVYDIMGRDITPDSQDLTANAVLIDLSSIGSGIYFIHVLLGTQSITKKISICREQ